ncbi:MAG: hypothetical protein GYA24_00795 [Candidatus Lokiarchaeota archaeon]|nr:hypothetical protein [Candidatus Lokiarchaeota archaeon]
MCPECTKQIDANIVLDVVDGKEVVLVRIKSAENGFFEDTISRASPTSCHSSKLARHPW